MRKMSPSLLVWWLVVCSVMHCPIASPVNRELGSMQKIDSLTTFNSEERHLMGICGCDSEDKIKEFHPDSLMTDDEEGQENPSAQNMPSDQPPSAFDPTTSQGLIQKRVTDETHHTTARPTSTSERFTAMKNKKALRIAKTNQRRPTILPMVKVSNHEVKKEETVAAYNEPAARGTTQTVPIVDGLVQAAESIVDDPYRSVSVVNYPAHTVDDAPVYGSTQTVNPSTIQTLDGGQAYQQPMIDGQPMVQQLTQDGRPSNQPMTVEGVANYLQDFGGRTQYGPAGSPQDRLAGFPQDGPAGSPQDGPAGSPQDGLAGFPQDGPAGFLQDGPVGFPQDGPAGFLQDVPAGSPQDGPAGSLKDGPAVSPHDEPAGFPQDGPAESPQNEPGGSLQDGSAGSPQDGPAGSPQDGTAGFSQDEPAGSPQDGPAGFPQDGPAGSPQYRPTGSLQDGPAGSPQDGTAGFPQDEPAGSPQDGPAGSPQYRPTGSLQDGPAGSFQDVPAGFAQYAPVGSPQYGAAGSIQYGRNNPAGSPQYGPAGSPQYGPAGSPQYGPAGSPQYGPARSPQYEPAGSPQYGPAGSSLYKPAPHPRGISHNVLTALEDGGIFSREMKKGFKKFIRAKTPPRLVDEL